MSENARTGASDAAGHTAEGSANPDDHAEDRRGVPKLMVLGTASAAVLVLLASGARTWVTGTADDSVLAQTAVSVAGRDAASGVVALALTAAAGVLAAVTGGRVVRWIGAGALTASGALALVLGGHVVLDPGAVVGRSAATQTGRTGTVDATGDVTVWVYLSLLAAAVLVLAGGAALVSVRRWGGLGGRYEAPTTTSAKTGHTGERESDWDRLSRGEDPT